jgi:hypothetical protein
MDDIFMKKFLFALPLLVLSASYANPDMDRAKEALIAEIKEIVIEGDSLRQIKQRIEDAVTIFHQLNPNWESFYCDWKNELGNDIGTEEFLGSIPRLFDLIRSKGQSNQREDAQPPSVKLNLREKLHDLRSERPQNQQPFMNSDEKPQPQKSGLFGQYTNSAVGGLFGNKQSGQEQSNQAPVQNPIPQPSQGIFANIQISQEVKPSGGLFGNVPGNQAPVQNQPSQSQNTSVFRLSGNAPQSFSSICKPLFKDAQGTKTQSNTDLFAQNTGLSAQSGQGQSNQATVQNQPSQGIFANIQSSQEVKPSGGLFDVPGNQAPVQKNKPSQSQNTNPFSLVAKPQVTNTGERPQPQPLPDESRIWKVIQGMGIILKTPCLSDFKNFEQLIEKCIDITNISHDSVLKNEFNNFYEIMKKERDLYDENAGDRYAAVRFVDTMKGALEQIKNQIPRGIKANFDDLFDGMNARLGYILDAHNIRSFKLSDLEDLVPDFDEESVGSGKKNPPSRKSDSVFIPLEKLDGFQEKISGILANLEKSLATSQEKFEKDRNVPSLIREVGNFQAAAHQDATKVFKGTPYEPHFDNIMRLDPDNSVADTLNEVVAYLGTMKKGQSNKPQNNDPVAKKQPSVSKEDEDGL